MSFKDKIDDLKDKFRWFMQPINFLIAIGSIYLTIYIFAWLGLKGFVGIAIGMTMMAYVFLSKNVLVLWLIKQFNSDLFIEEVKKK